MTLPIKLISTDFDGTLFAEFEQPQPPLEKGAERQVVAVEMVEYSEFEPGHERNH